MRPVSDTVLVCGRMLPIAVGSSPTKVVVWLFFRWLSLRAVGRQSRHQCSPQTADLGASCAVPYSPVVMCGLSKYSKRPRGIQRWREGTDGGALATLQPLKRGGKLHAGNSQPMKAFAVINFKLHVQAQFTTHTPWSAVTRRICPPATH